MINENFVFLGSVIFALGSVPYFLDTIKGKVKPNRVTWFIWSIAPLIAFSAQIKEGVGIHQSLLTFTVGFVPLVIFIASFVNKKSYWQLGRLDLSCGALSLIGLVLWIATENWVIYFAASISALITLFTIKVWDFETFAFSLYIFLLTLMLSGLIKFRLGQRIQKSFPN